MKPAPVVCDPVEVRSGAIEAAVDMGRLLADPDVVAAAVRQSRNASQHPFGWGLASLAGGPVGSALALREISRVDHQHATAWASAAHQQLVDAVGSTHEVPLSDTSLFSGSAGLLLAFLDARRDDPRYDSVARSVAAGLAESIHLAGSWRGWDGLADADFDIISGSAGTLIALAIAVAELDAPAPVVSAGLRLVEDLEWMCRPAGRRAEPPWWTAPHSYPSEAYTEVYPHGYVNTGMAHGVPGVLTALSIAYRCGLTTPTLVGTVRRTATWLLEVAVSDQDGDNWPSGVPLDADRQEMGSAGLPPSRTAWCYGVPGIVTALLRAAEALGDQSLATRAVRAADTVVAKASAQGPLSAATLCHGSAGLVVMAVDAYGSDPTSRPKVDLLVEHLLTHRDTALPLHVQDLEPPDIMLDDPSLLTGSAGVALALIAGTHPARQPLWMAALGVCEVTAP